MATDQNDRLLEEILTKLGEVADLLRGTPEEAPTEEPAAPAPKKRATTKQATKAAS